MKTPNTNPIVTASRELGESLKDTAGLLSGMNEGVAQVNQLYDHGYGGAGKGLISFGFALVMLPEPTMISDVVGCGIIGAGVIYNRVCPPPIFVDDIFETIEEQVKSLGSTGEDLTRNFSVPVDFSSMRLDF